MKARSFGLAAAFIAMVFMIGCGGGGSTSGGSTGSGGPGGGAPAAANSYTSVSGALETSGGRPVIRFFGTSWCPHSSYLAAMFDSVAREYAAAGKVVARHWQLDTGDDTLTPGMELSVPLAEMDVFRRFNAEESVPTLVIAGRFFRIGTAYEGLSGGLALEERDLRAAIDAVIRETTVAPTVATLAATAVTSTGATLNGNVNPGGLPTVVWFEWGTDPALSNPTATGSQAVGSGTTVVPASQPIGGLAEYSLYYYRVVAQNGMGTAVGQIGRFVTSAREGALPFDEGLGTILRGALVDNAAAAALSIPAGYFRLGEFRNFADTTRKCITIGILRNYHESTLDLGDPEPNIPRENEEWVFPRWDAWSYDASAYSVVVRDLHGHTLAFDIRFNQPTSGVNTVVSAAIDGIPIALSTQSYTTQLLNTYGWSEEPPWFVPPN